MIDESTAARIAPYPNGLLGWLLDRNRLAASLVGMAVIYAILSMFALERTKASDQARQPPSCVMTALGDVGSCSDGTQ